MKTVVITGNTRGIGYGLADSFLALERIFNILADRVETVTPWLAQTAMVKDIIYHK